MSSWIAAQELGKPRKGADKFNGPPREPPDRPADALHLKLEVAFDWDKEEVAGKATHTLRSFRKNLSRITLDGVELDVQRVTDREGRPLGFETLPDKVAVQLPQPAQSGEDISFSIEYRCRPKRGIYFRKPDAGATDIPRQVWSQGESNDARHWIPCFDHPSDKLTTEVEVTAPEKMAAVSNGKLASTRPAPDGKGQIFHWKQEKPHTTYLIVVAVGEFAEYRGSWKEVPLIAYVPASQAPNAARSFELTADMMDFFSQKTGFPYPWDKYAQICVHEFLFGGMENTSATVLTEKTLHDERAHLDVDSMDLVSHELAHQWFGDLVTCKDWADIWLNESFATFFATLYRGHRLGWDEEVFDRKGQANGYLAEDRDQYRRPLSTRRYTEADAMFDAHTYPKGGRILAMLMNVLGEEAFFKGIKLYLDRHAYTAVETDDFRLAMEDASGRSLRWFFDEWVHSGGHPEFYVSYTYDEDSRTVRLSVAQKQNTSDGTPIFRMPVDIEITTPSGRTLHRVEISKKEEQFTFPSADRPRLVAFDKHDWILKEIVFPRSREELIYQLENDDALMGRFRAATELGKLGSDAKAREALLRRLRDEPFWGVRAEIASALKNFKEPSVTAALAEAFKSEKKARVRQEILRSLKELPGAETAALARSALEKDLSYFTASEALSALATLEGAKAMPDLLAALERESHNDVIRSTAMASLAELAEKEKLSEAEKKNALDKLIALSDRKLPVSTRAAAIRALGRMGKGAEAVFQVLSQAIDDPFISLRLAVFDALGSLGDPRGIAALQARRGKEGHRPFHDPIDSIDEAIRRIEGRDDKKVLHDELRRLREGQERLEKRFDELEKARKPPQKL
ncbi:MAG: DUF3458 domain-containing protein [Planctomycetes bacterium]|nr:DUF3458 domain-containing protein [Planctomycetota bacterium]